MDMEASARDGEPVVLWLQNWDYGPGASLPLDHLASCFLEGTDVGWLKEVLPTGWEKAAQKSVKKGQ